MRRLLKSIVSLMMVLSLLAGLLCVGSITASAASSKTLSLNSTLLSQVGAQPSGSYTCSCYALAYARTILDGKAHSYSEYNQYGADHYNVIAIWSKGGYWSVSAGSRTAVFQACIDSINANTPILIHVYSKYGQHWVTVVGYQNVTTASAMSESNLLIIDPACGYSGGTPSSLTSYTLNTSYSYVRTSYTASPISYTSIEKDTYFIKNKSSGNYLVVEQSKDVNTQNIGVYPLTDESGMKIEIVEESNKQHRLRPLCSASRVVNVYADTITANHNVNLYDNTNESSQRWLFEKLDSGYYVIRNAQNSSCVLTQNGLNCIATNYIGADRQLWGLERVQKPDTTPPTLSNVTISDLDETGYLITAEIWDDTGIKEVYFPTWTAYNDQDDITWFKGTVSGSTVTFRVNTYDHNDETGLYITDIHVYDTSGNCVYYHLEVDVPAPDTTPLTIESYEVYDVDETGYSIKIIVSDNVGVTRVACPTWTEANEQDDLLWKDAVIEGNTATFRVDVADHNHELGTYITDVYVYDASGNRVTSNWIWVYVTALSAPTKTVTWNGHIYAFYETYRSWTVAKELCEQLGGHLATITSAEEQAFLQTHTDENWYWIGATDEKTEGQWEWVTGEAWNYTAWAENQPDNAVSNEHYTHLMPSGEWNDIHHEPNEYKVGFILEIDPEENVAGDIDGNGTVNLADAMRVFYQVANKITLEGNAFTAADIDGNGTINLADAMKVFYFVANKIDSL